MMGAYRYLRSGMRLMLGILLLSWFGGGISARIAPPLAVAEAPALRACTASDTGLDIVFLVDRSTPRDQASERPSYEAARDAVDSAILYLNARALLQRPVEHFSVATLVYNVNDEDDIGANTDHVEAARPALTVPFSTPEALYGDPELLKAPLSWFEGKDREPLLWDFKAPYQTALEHLPGGSQRPKLVISMIYDFLASGAGSIYAAGFNEVGGQYKQKYGTTFSVYVLGFSSQSGTRLSDARRQYAALLSEAQRPEEAIRAVTAATVETVVLQILREHLCTPESSGASMVEALQGQSSFRVAAYQRELKVFWFSAEAVSRLDVATASGEPQTDKHMFSQQAWGVVSVPNPQPGTWTVSGTSIEAKPLSAFSLEIIQTAADKAFAVTINGAPASPRVGQRFELRWWMADAQNKPLTYSDPARRLQAVTATLTVEGTLYQLPLDYQQEDGTYVGRFVAAQPGHYEVIIEPRLAGTGEVLTASAPNLGPLDLTETFTMEPIKLVVNPTPASLEQFRSVSFTVELRDAKTGVLVTDLAREPEIAASIIVQGRSVQDLSMRPGTSAAQFISEEITLLYQDFTLEVQATIKDFNGTSKAVSESIRLPLKPAPDPAGLRFTNATPNVLEEINVEYVPSRLSPAEFEALRIEVVAEVQEQAEDGTGALWRLPLTVEGDRYVVSFYASRPVPHTLSLKGILKPTGETLFTQEKTFNVQPITLVVNLTPARLQQFQKSSFAVELRNAITDALVTDLAREPEVTAKIVVQDKTVQELTMRPGDVPAQFISEEITLLYQDFTLEVQATVEHFDRSAQLIGEPVRLRLSATPDPGSVRFTNATPYVLEETEIRYEPARLSPAELEAFQIEVIAEVEEEVEDGTGALWQLPLEVENNRYVTSFYASRAVPHKLRLRGILKQTGETLFIQDIPGRLNPSLVEIRYKGPANLQQFETLKFDLSIVSQGTSVTEWSPSALAKLRVSAEIKKDDVSYPLTLQGDPASGYSSSIELDEYGTYTVAITAVAQRYPGATRGDPTISLPVSGAPVLITCSPTTASLRVVNAQGDAIPGTTQALTPVTLEFGMAADYAAMSSPSGEPPQATLWLTYPDQTTILSFDVSYNFDTRSFRKDGFVPVEPGVYTLEASLWRPKENVQLTLLDKDQTTPYSFTVTPVYICADRLGKSIYKPGERLSVHLWLCSPDGTALSSSPAIAPPMTLDLQQASPERALGKWPGERPFNPEGERLADYRIEGNIPQETGKYLLKPSVVVKDSNDHPSTLTFPPSTEPLTFVVGEGKPLKMRVETAYQQDSITTRWFLEDEVPLVVKFGVQTLSGEPVSLTPETLGCRLDACFKVEVRDEDGRLVKGWLGAPTLADPGQYTVQYAIYNISHPWMGKRRFTVDVSFANPEQLKVPYVVDSSNLVSSYEVRYGPELWKVLLVPGMVGVFVVVAGVLIYRWHWIIFPPKGELQLVDSNDQNLLDPIVLTRGRNRYGIPADWKIALVDRIYVASNWHLSRNNRLKVTVFYHKGDQKGEPYMLQDGGKVQLKGTPRGYYWLRYERRPQKHKS